MSRAKPEHALARGLEGQEIRPMLDRSIRNSATQKDWPLIFADVLSELPMKSSGSVPSDLESSFMER